MNIDYQNIEDNETKLERDIEDIENLKDNLLDSLTEAKEINCESETRLRRSIRESKLALADLKQKITETNNYIIFNTISNIRKLSREVE
jgi:t-SNARE complex subunit (syntaxin)